MNDQAHEVTQILERIEHGDARAADDLLPMVYEELRKLAAARLRREQPGQTVQATALVHDAYVRLVDGQRAQKWNSRGHFFAAAAEAMRRILVDNARRKHRPKHGGDRRRVELEEAGYLISGNATSEDGADQVLAIDEALSKLAAESPDQARLVKLRYFGGMSLQDAAQAMGISRATASRYWAYAKAFLYLEMQDAE